MRCLFAAAVLALVTAACFGQAAGVPEPEPRKRGFFSWVSDLFAAKQESQSGGSTALIDAQQILRRDNQREEAKEKAYWEAIRKTDEKTLGDRTRAASAARLSAARDRGQILSAYDDARRGAKSRRVKPGRPKKLCRTLYQTGRKKILSRSFLRSQRQMGPVR